MSIHPAAGTGFAREAETYERTRPSYPDEAVTWLVEQLGISEGVTVVDLAAGTGKLTRLLRPTGARVIAVEPVGPMLSELRRAVPDVEVVRGTAEAIPLAGAAADAVTVAQAFHWFDVPPALAEIHRVLGRDGGLGLIWNGRDLTDPLQQELSAVIEPHRGDAPVYARDLWRDAFERSELFGPLSGLKVPFHQELDVEGVVDRVTSTSCIASLPAETLEQVRGQVRDVAARSGEPLTLRYETRAFVSRSRSDR